MQRNHECKSGHHLRRGIFNVGAEGYHKFWGKINSGAKSMMGHHQRIVLPGEIIRRIIFYISKNPLNNHYYSSENRQGDS